MGRRNNPSAEAIEASLEWWLSVELVKWKALSLPARCASSCESCDGSYSIKLVALTLVARSAR